MKEIFKNIEGFEGYQISNLGNVKSLNYNRTGKEQILKPTKDKDGYLYVSLCKQGKRKCYKIHRLVAQAFLDNPNNYPIINHRDENPLNNNVTNLEFCTPKYNCNYGSRNEKLSKQVLCVETGVIYPSLSEVYRQLGFSQSNIYSACTGRYKQAYGFHWKYVE